VCFPSEEGFNTPHIASGRITFAVPLPSPLSPSIRPPSSPQAWMLLYPKTRGDLMFIKCSSPRPHLHGHTGRWSYGLLHRHELRAGTGTPDSPRNSHAHHAGRRLAKPPWTPRAVITELRLAKGIRYKATLYVMSLGPAPLILGQRFYQDMRLVVDYGPARTCSSLVRPIEHLRQCRQCQPSLPHGRPLHSWRRCLRARWTGSYGVLSAPALQ
jgi:hypothetical protein